MRESSYKVKSCSNTENVVRRRQSNISRIGCCSIQHKHLTHLFQKLSLRLICFPIDKQIWYIPILINQINCVGETAKVDITELNVKMILEGLFGYVRRHPTHRSASLGLLNGSNFHFKLQYSRAAHTHFPKICVQARTLTVFAIIDNPSFEQTLKAFEGMTIVYRKCIKKIKHCLNVF